MRTSITWDSKNTPLPPLDYTLLAQWIEAVATTHGRKVREVAYLFCDDNHILDVNREFLQHDYYTDIITFDYCRGTLLRGDIVISLDTVRSNAIAVGATYDTELLRVIIHGILHLCGINDKGPGEREIMESFENEALTLYDQLSRSKSAD